MILEQQYATFFKCLEDANVSYFVKECQKLNIDNLFVDMTQYNSDCAVYDKALYVLSPKKNELLGYFNSNGGVIYKTPKMFDKKGRKLLNIPAELLV